VSHVRTEQESLVEQLRDDIDNDRLILPTLPEIALKVRDALQDPDTDARRIAALISQDAALSIRLLQVANSASYRGPKPFDSVQAAVTRLGLSLVRSLVTSLAMKQLFQATSTALDRAFREIWDQALQVSAISRVLSYSVRHIDTEQATLGGLIHNIGALPILARIEASFGFAADELGIQELVAAASPEVGRRVLEHWEFPDGLIAIPEGCLNLAYDPGPRVELVDIVIVARLQHIAARADPESWRSWHEVPAFAKLGIDTEVEQIDLEGGAEELAEARALLDN
jgi:HD-like signal output (HDOD) protein